MEARPSTAAPRRLLLRLLAGTIVPTIAALALFGFFAHEVARRALEDELGRRLATAAAGTAATLLPEQLSAFGAGDEDSLTYANVRRRLEAARLHLGVRRVLVVTPDLETRGDTSSALPLGAHAYELDADRAEITRAMGGRRPRRRCSSATTASPTSAPTPPSVRRATSPASSPSKAPPTIRRRWRRSGARWSGPASARCSRCWR